MGFLLQQDSPEQVHQGVVDDGNESQGPAAALLSSGVPRDGTYLGDNQFLKQAERFSQRGRLDTKSLRVRYALVCPGRRLVAWSGVSALIWMSRTRLCPRALLLLLSG